MLGSILELNINKLPILVRAGGLCITSGGFNRWLKARYLTAVRRSCLLRSIDIEDVAILKLKVVHQFSDRSTRQS
jgi:hypothetical protein